MDNELFVKVKSGNSDKQMLFFPYLGGSMTSFHELIKTIKCYDVEIWTANPPGHMGSKLPLMNDMTSLVDMYFDQFKNIIKSECYLFGHSMGGNIAYFLAKKLYESDMYRDCLKGLILSASSPPLFSYKKKYSELSDDALIAQIMEYQALPKELLESKELMNMLLPVFRADYRIIESGAEIEIENKLPVDTYLIWGEDDLVDPIELMPMWEKYVKMPFMLLPVKNGEHMLIHNNIDVVSSYIENILAGKYSYNKD